VVGIVDSISLREHLPPSEWLYGTDATAALAEFDTRFFSPSRLRREEALAQQESALDEMEEVQTAASMVTQS
jgi:precorrin-3B methylase